LLTKSIPEGHEEELRTACRAGVKALIDEADRFRNRLTAQSEATPNQGKKKRSFSSPHDATTERTV